MGRKYDIYFKEMIVDAYKKGTYGGEIVTARHFGVPQSSLKNWIKKDKIQGNQINDINKTKGRKKEENIDYKERYEILKKYQAFLKAQRERK